MFNHLQLPSPIALDLGTTKFCIAKLRPTAPGEAIPEIATISVDADGMRRGMLASLPKAQAALERLVEISERELCCDIHKVVVGVAGSHLQSRFLTTSLALGDRKVVAPLLAELARQAQQQHAGLGREFLHLLPLSYQVDERGWVDNPLGFSGKTLTAKFFAVEADKHYLSDIIALCNSCGLEVSRFYAEPLASSGVVSSGEAKRYGLVTIDIGGGTSDGIIYVGGKPVKTFTVNIAGKLMSSDLSIGLGVPCEEAERIKLKYGLLCPSSEQRIEVRGVSGQAKMVSLSRVHGILAARITELTTLIHAEVKPFAHQLNSGLLLTGGGAEVQGIEDFIAGLLKKEVCKEDPVISQANFPLTVGAKACDDKRYLASKYATVVGLLHLELNHQMNAINARKSPMIEKYFHQFFNWLRELA